LIQGSVYRSIAGFVIILIAVLAIGILPLVLILIKTVICIIQIILDLQFHPHHRIFWTQPSRQLADNTTYENTSYKIQYQEEIHPFSIYDRIVA